MALLLGVQDLPQGGNLLLQLREGHTKMRDAGSSLKLVYDSVMYQIQQSKMMGEGGAGADCHHAVERER